MSQLVNQLVEQFTKQSKYQHFIRQFQDKFDIYTYRFQQMTPSLAKKGYNQLMSKYQNQILKQSPRSWHENQRKLFVWFLLALLKNIKQSHHKIEQQHWELLSETFFHKDILFLKYQYNAIQKSRKRQQWTQQQDQIIKSCSEHVQNTNWNEIAKQIFFRTDSQCYKSAKQCRQRWQNHLDERINREQWKFQQDLTVLKFVLQNGKKWSKIVEQLQNTRTEHMVKNRFKSLIFKKENQLKIQDHKCECQKIIIQSLISQMHQKNPSIELKSQLENPPKDRDHKELELPEIKLNGQNKIFPFHGIIQRGENGKFNNNNFFYQSQASSIFECRSPASLNLNSSGLISPQSQICFAPLSATSTGDTNVGMDCQYFPSQKWNGVLNKASISSDASNMTHKLIKCGRREDNLRFSFELKSLQNGEKNYPNGMDSSIIQSIENHLLGNQQKHNNQSKNNPLENSQFYTSTLNQSFVLSNQALSKSQVYQKQKHI